ncbi:MAG: flavodoxin family protein [Clostridiales bacterium]|nr:flavodoxin family protein [Clostridiales bacterium]
MIKILAISGSSQKNGTGIDALRMFEEKFDKQSYAFEVLHLADYQINNCIGCKVCFKKETCFMKDDLPYLVNKMEAADGIVIISPVYAMNISGILKTFLDRTTYLLHKPKFFDKHSYIISSTDFGGTKIVNTYLKYMMNAYCMDNVGATGVLSNKLKKDENYKQKLSKRFEKEAENFKRALNNGKEYQPKLAQLLRFNLWKTKGLKSKDSYLGDYQYWSDSKRLNAQYFYPIELGLIKKGLVKIVKFRVSKLIDKKT